MPNPPITAADAPKPGLVKARRRINAAAQAVSEGAPRGRCAGRA